ncbi:DUF4148 domain-containing protein [Glaciimonas immobilis]|uniref:DUF4148 domain-containing protein n=1 Tax=Glaciimonas immobilis TaxID=728004 RepID=A0A840RSP4_9BURK|nr:DUF4148 domain-containing protein [Glaciimonas immobilis]KAF3996838.1 DUF4148 domain-containing protein [Glaciimonas immobilis]MBB5199611.1 hypothetical protein [Glaciimonas immobilis]
MNIQKLLISAAFVATTAAVAGSAFAEATYPVETPTVSTKTRAEVIAQLTQAGDEGRLNYARNLYPVTPVVASTKTRAEVIAELTQAQDEGRMNYARNLYPATPVSASTKTRAQVRAEVALADTDQYLTGSN